MAETILMTLALTVATIDSDATIISAKLLELLFHAIAFTHLSLTVVSQGQHYSPPGSRSMYCSLVMVREEEIHVLEVVGAR
jgi:hypothetical protein